MLYGWVRGLLELKNLACVVRVVGFYTLARQGEDMDGDIKAQFAWCLVWNVAYRMRGNLSIYVI